MTKCMYEELEVFICALFYCSYVAYIDFVILFILNGACKYNKFPLYLQSLKSVPLDFN